MNAWLAPSFLLLLLLASALGGPVILRAAAPALMRAPRTAAVLLLLAGLIWPASIAAFFLMTAWLVEGPTVLPDSIGGICQKCLAASSPLQGVPVVESFIPAFALVLIPLGGLVLIFSASLIRGARRLRRVNAAALAVAQQASPALVLGHQVLLVRDESLTAYALPRRGGIVISERLTLELDRTELAAILAHEQTHVTERHHLALALIDVVFTQLRWIPLIAEIMTAVPHYLEIAADNAARRETGTAALASALLRLGASGADTLTHHGSHPLALNAAGPNRVKHLVAPARLASALAPTLTAITAALCLMLMAASVVVPYFSALLTRCELSI